MPRASKKTTAAQPAPSAVQKPLKVATIQGVPYWVNEQNEIFVWGSEPHLKIGTTDEKRTTVVLEDNWEAKMGAYLAAYRENLKTLTKDALKRAEELQGST